MSLFPTFRRWIGPQRARPVQQLALLRLIAVSIEERLPLAPLLEAWATDERGKQSQRLTRLAALLREGVSLPDAMEQVPDIVRDEDALAIRFDAQSGTGTAAVRAALDNFPLEPAVPAHGIRNSSLYFLIILALMVPVVAFVQIKIIPEFEKILEEFEMPAPDFLRWSVSVATLFESFWWLIPIVAVLLAWMLLSSRAGRFIRNRILGRVFRPLRVLRSADVLQKIGVALGAGRSVSSALSTLARYHFDPATRHKLLFVRNEVEQGADAWHSMHEAGFITQPELHLITTSDRVGNKPWILRQLARLKGRRTKYRLQRWSEFVLPAVVLLLGLVVLFQALALFQPLVRIIQSLA